MQKKIKMEQSYIPIEDPEFLTDKPPVFSLNDTLYYVLKFLEEDDGIAFFSAGKSFTLFYIQIFSIFIRFSHVRKWMPLEYIKKITLNDYNSSEFSKCDNVQEIFYDKTGIMVDLKHKNDLHSCFPNLKNLIINNGTFAGFSLDKLDRLEVSLDYFLCLNSVFEDTGNLRKLIVGKKKGEQKTDSFKFKIGKNIEEFEFYGKKCDIYLDTSDTNNLKRLVVVANSMVNFVSPNKLNNIQDIQFDISSGGFGMDIPLNNESLKIVGFKYAVIESPNLSKMELLRKLEVFSLGEFGNIPFNSVKKLKLTILSNDLDLKTHFPNLMSFETKNIVKSVALTFPDSLRVLKIDSLSTNDVINLPANILPKDLEVLIFGPQLRFDKLDVHDLTKLRMVSGSINYSIHHKFSCKPLPSLMHLGLSKLKISTGCDQLLWSSCFMNLKSLYICELRDPLVVPNLLEVLSIQFGFDHKISLPNSLKFLSLGDHFNQELVLPENITGVIFGLSFDKPVVLPDTITYFNFGNHMYSHPIIFPRFYRKCMIPFDRFCKMNGGKVFFSKSHRERTSAFINLFA